MKKEQVSREIQRNDFSFEHMKESLNNLGFTMEQCSICQYGKSVVDMYFYKDDGGMIKCAVIVESQDVENEQHG